MKKKDNNKRSISQLFNFMQDSYFERTSRPIYSIIFLLPFIIFYEFGTIFINTDALNQTQVRVVAFVWLQQLLEYLGFSSRFAWMAPALAAILILLGLQLTSHKKWHFCLKDVWPMLVECILLAVPLLVLSLFLNSSADSPRDISRFDNNNVRIHSEAIPACFEVAEDSSYQQTTNGDSCELKKSSLLTNIVTGLGAGIYEELVFRLILICVLMILLQNVFRINHKSSVIFAILISAAMFSAHHHIIFLNGRFGQTAAFNWTEFGFRTIAGIYFAVLFAIRGFGITAGTHTFYDIIATAVNAVFFQQ